MAPTATKNAMGTANTAGEIEFAVKVKVNSSDTRLKIGMNVRLNLIIEEGENVLTVPYDAVYTNDIGQSCVMILQEGTDGSQTLYEVVVETGIANDTDIVISGTGIEEGMQIISSPSSYKDMLGKTVTLTTYSSTLIEQRMSMLGG